MKIATSVTVWNDAIGKRVSISYSEVDETTGKITADNKRLDRVVTDSEKVAALNQILTIGQEYIDGLDS